MTAEPGLIHGQKASGNQAGNDRQTRSEHYGQQHSFHASMLVSGHANVVSPAHRNSV